MEFHERLRALRVARGFTQEELAAQVGIQPGTGTIGVWERAGGKPRFDQLALLARVLHTSGDFLLGLTDDPAPRDGAESPDVTVQVMALADLVEVLAREARRPRGSRP